MEQEKNGIKTDFLEEYGDLVLEDIPRFQLPIPTPNIPEKYRKQFCHTKDGFVAKYCADYENSPKQKCIRRKYNSKNN